jgi:hypothetical protein
MFFDEMKRNPNENFTAEDEVPYHFTVALYRFVARRLSLVEFHEDKVQLYYYIKDGANLWPHSFDTDKLEQYEYFEPALSIFLTKMGDVLDEIPFQSKRTTTEAIMVDKRES